MQSPIPTLEIISPKPWSKSAMTMPGYYHAKNERSVVMISLEDYQSLEETAYLLRNPKNSCRLLEAVAKLESGGGMERELSE
jgi:hypothetical protein